MIIDFRFAERASVLAKIQQVFQIFTREEAEHFALGCNADIGKIDLIAICQKAKLTKRLVFFDFCDVMGELRFCQPHVNDCFLGFYDCLYFPVFAVQRVIRDPVPWFSIIPIHGNFGLYFRMVSQIPTRLFQLRVD